MEKTLLYSENGYKCHGENNDYKSAKNILKNKGYKIAFSGHKFNKYGIKVLVGINGDNAINIKERRKNGLFNARQINL